LSRLAGFRQLWRGCREELARESYNRGVAMAESSQPKQTVRLEWEDVEDLQTLYANHIVVTHASGDEFYLVFGEAAPPTAFLQRQTIDRVPIRPVAKIAVSPGSMFRIAQAITQNAQLFLERTRAAREEDAEPTH
jgi:hypothetical protein